MEPDGCCSSDVIEIYDEKHYHSNESFITTVSVHSLYLLHYHWVDMGCALKARLGKLQHPANRKMESFSPGTGDLMRVLFTREGKGQICDYQEDFKTDT